MELKVQWEEAASTLRDVPRETAQQAGLGAASGIWLTQRIQGGVRLIYKQNNTNQL